MTDPVAIAVDDGHGGSHQVRCLDPPGPHAVGRADGAAVPVSDRRVSRDHGVLAVEDGRWWYRNRSASGSFVDGARVESVPVDGTVTVRLADAADGPAVWLSTGLTPPLAEPIRIGREQDNQVVLPELTVSRRHALMQPDGAGWRVVDLGSENGTYVNGRRVSRVVLRDGDVLTVGKTDLRFEAGRVEAVNSCRVQLQARSLGYSLSNGTSLLGDIDLDLASGTLVAVIGPSGAGKSTFAKVLTGALGTTSGVVTFDGFDMHRDLDVLRTRVGYVPQDDIVHHRLTCRQALSYGARLRLPEAAQDEVDRRIDGVLSELSLAQHADTRVDRLSGGQRKRVSTALELLTEPSLLVLDEPTSGLDPHLDEQLMLSLRGIADTGRVVVVITHNPSTLELCDLVLLLAPGGKPAFLGRSPDLLASYGTSAWPAVFGQVSGDPAAAHAAYRARTPRPADRSTTDPSQEPFPGNLGSREHDPGVVPRVQRRWLLQARTLAMRHLQLIVADRPYAAFLAALPVALALLALVVPGSAGLEPPAPDAPSEPSQLLVVVVVGTAFMGAAASAREVVGERTILARERAAGLRVRAYVTAKLGVFAIVCAAQAVLLVATLSMVKAMPTDGALLPPGFEVVLAVGLTAYASCLLALWGSALVRSTEQVMPLLVLTVMAQLVFSGGVITITGRALLTAVSVLVPARWGYATSASTVDLRDLVPNGPQDALWTSSPGWWLLGVVALLGLSAAFGGATCWQLSRDR